jgi:hypothetical protein
MICIMGGSCSPFVYTNDFTNTSSNLLNEDVFFISCFQAMLYVIYNVCNLSFVMSNKILWFWITLHIKFNLVQN